MCLTLPGSCHLQMFSTAAGLRDVCPRLPQLHRVCLFYCHTSGMLNKAPCQQLIELQRVVGGVVPLRSSVRALPESANCATLCFTVSFGTSVDSWDALLILLLRPASIRGHTVSLSARRMRAAFCHKLVCVSGAARALCSSVGGVAVEKFTAGLLFVCRVSYLSGKTRCVDSDVRSLLEGDTGPTNRERRALTLQQRSPRATRGMTPRSL